MPQGIKPVAADTLIGEALSLVERPDYAIAAFLEAGHLNAVVIEVQRRLNGQPMTTEDLPMIVGVLTEFLRGYEQSAGRATTAAVEGEAPAAFFPAPLPGPEGEDGVFPNGWEMSPESILRLRQHAALLMIEATVARWKAGELSVEAAAERVAKLLPTTRP